MCFGFLARPIDIAIHVNSSLLALVCDTCGADTINSLLPLPSFPLDPHRFEADVHSSLFVFRPQVTTGAAEEIERVQNSTRRDSDSVGINLKVCIAKAHLFPPPNLFDFCYA